MARIAEFKYLDDDEERIGTADYKGYAFFWAYDYRHYMSVAASTGTSSGSDST